MILPFLAWADDDYCLDGIRTDIMVNPLQLPKELAAAIKVPANLGKLKRTKEEYLRRLSYENRVSGIEYNYELHLPPYRFEVTYEISAGQRDSTILYTIQRDISVYGKGNIEVYDDTLKTTYHTGCNPTPMSHETTTYTNTRKGIRIDSVVSENEFATKKHSVLVDRQLYQQGRILDGLESAKGLRAAGFTDGKTIKLPMLEEDVLSTTTVQFYEAVPLRRYNRAAGKIETMTGLEMATEQVRIIYYDSPTNDYSVQLTVSGSSRSWKETTSKAEWLTDQPTPAPHKYSIEGFSTDDFKSERLHLAISSLSLTPKVHNLAAYMDVEPNTANSGAIWSLQGHFPSSMVPSSLPWNAPTEAEDKPYLQFTRYIQAEPVKPIVDELRPQVSGLTRLEASVKIIEELVKRIRYDTPSVKNGLTSIRPVDQVIREGKGVCQHYAAVFAAVARSLGIPTRIIYGYALEATTLIGHAWVEVKINHDQWWPLDPQKAVAKLPTRDYIPIGEYKIYEVQRDMSYDENRAATNEVNRGFLSWDDARIKKLP